MNAQNQPTATFRRAESNGALSPGRGLLVAFVVVIIQYNAPRDLPGH